MSEVIIFCLIVGIGSTVVLDVFVSLVHRPTGIPPTDWGTVGRWLLGVGKGQLILDPADESPPTHAERIVGWLFHYLVGVAYAAAIVALWGPGYIAAPTILPVVVVGVLISTLAGLTILLPGLGAGFMGSKLPNQFAIIAYLIVAHVVFAAGQYGFALLHNTASGPSGEPTATSSMLLSTKTVE
ncbi:MAG: DUF2938 family protein [Proteobacteria bacterium]|nr:DUF2938 family protein [Pseudomonadota bacterium]